jgi:hypothetical protein
VVEYTDASPHSSDLLLAALVGPNKATCRDATTRKCDFLMSRDEMFQNTFDHQIPRRRPQYPPPPPKISTNTTIIRINSMELLRG